MAEQENIDNKKEVDIRRNKRNKFKIKPVNSNFFIKIGMVFLLIVSVIFLISGFLQSSIYDFSVGLSLCFIIYFLSLFFNISISNIFKKKSDVKPIADKKDENLPIIFKAIIFVVIAALLIGFTYYVAVPSLNFQSTSFIWFLATALFIISQVVTYIVYSILKTLKKRTTSLQKLEAISGASTVIACILFSVIGSISGAKMFRAKDYSNLLPIQYIDDRAILNQSFSIDNDQILLPSIDKDIAYRHAQIALGEYGNQYHINYNYLSIQGISVDGEQKIIRTAPLEYSNFVVSMQNNNKGTPGFVVVDVMSGETKLYDEKKLVYMPSSKFSKNLLRHIQTANLTMLFDNYYFEIDDDFNPYWIVPYYNKTIGLFGGKVPSGVLTVDACTGEMNKYSIKEAPEWIDNVVDKEIVKNSALYALKYKKGFINSIGAKTGVYELNDGYNFFIKNGESYYVSSVTSSDVRDQTSIGFLTINLSSGRAKLYVHAGITEGRAMTIARTDDSVKAMNLNSTWPLFITINNTPSYYLTLKNDVKIQKYVFMDQLTGENLVIADTIEDAKKEYIKLINKDSTDIEEYKDMQVVERATINGDKVYIKFVNIEDIFVVDLSLDYTLALIKPNDKLSFSAYRIDEKLCQIVSIFDIELV